MSIADLPTELLLEVASYLGFDDPSHIHLAITCRSFYGIFMHSILADQVEHVCGLIESSKITLYKDLKGRGAVTKQAFRSGPECEPKLKFRTSYRKIIYRIGHGGIVEKDLWCAKALIARALHLQYVVLQLGEEACGLQKLAAIISACAVRRDVHLTVTGTIPGCGESGGPFIIEFQSSESLLCLKEIISSPLTPRKAKRHLRSFMSSVFHPLQSNLKSKVSKRQHLLKEGNSATEFSTLSTEQTIYATVRIPQFDIMPPPRLLLSSFGIDSETLFLPSLYPFTLNILNHAPINTLSLSHISLTLFVWSQILPSITIPALTNLAIGDLNIAFPDLLVFLQRHSFIEVLDLTGNNLIGIANIPGSTALLPLLSSLTASSEYIILFLQQKKLGSFPLLHHFHLRSPGDISPPSIDLYPSSYPEHPNHTIYDSMSNSQASLTYLDLSLTLDVLATSGLIDWLLSASKDQKMTATPRLSSVRTLVIADQADEKLSIPSDLMRRLFRWISDDDSSSLVIKKRRGDYDSPFSREHQIVERLIWFMCPCLETLQLGLGERGRPSPIRLNRTSWE